ncbi:hypothetical protein M427DRAFT_30895 [Gonapodya prolifera JEL478]|uniref:Low temperature viability protein n=1 Tax=Gonapodya prolifera (strain JEL478) TaxID=1344416 RepID=A0A139AIY4_GONPJ|nr:hypothetical protein M427DRAFT_30895 [Gonapodya prolifera JEL478]|eukprot:KXS16771.1 hypothetical protein M427DRAFT_30895 [Gonapodya prolifera JEL478]
MGKKRKEFIDRHSARHFKVVHRSQRDPALADDAASKYVLLETDISPNIAKKNPKPTSLDDRFAHTDPQDFDGDDPSFVVRPGGQGVLRHGEHDDSDDEDWDGEDGEDVEDDEGDEGQFDDASEDGEHGADASGAKRPSGSQGAAGTAGKSAPAAQPAPAAPGRPSKTSRTPGTAALHGIFFPDLDYDYTTHLRPIGAAPGGVFVPRKPTASEARAADKDKGKVRFKDDVPAEALPSGWEEDVGMLNRAAPGADDIFAVDPRVREALYALDDEAYVVRTVIPKPKAATGKARGAGAAASKSGGETSDVAVPVPAAEVDDEAELDVDFDVSSDVSDAEEAGFDDMLRQLDTAGGGGENDDGGDDGWFDQRDPRFDDAGADAGEDEDDAGRPAWMKEFGKYKRAQKRGEDASDDGSGGSEDEDDDDGDDERRRRYARPGARTMDDLRSVGTGLSMTSAAVERSKWMRGVDERFERVLDEYEDDKVGELDPRGIRGVFSDKPAAKEARREEEVVVVEEADGDEDEWEEEDEEDGDEKDGADDEDDDGGDDEDGEDVPLPEHIDRVLDEFLATAPKGGVGPRQEVPRDDARAIGAGQLEELRAGLRDTVTTEVIARAAAAGAIGEEEEDVLLDERSDVDDEERRWDVQTALTAYTNIYNRPTVVREGAAPKKKRGVGEEMGETVVTRGRIGVVEVVEVDKRSGMPIVNLADAAAKRVGRTDTAVGKPARDVSAGGASDSEEDDGESVAPRLVLPARVKGETAEEKRARKEAVKAAKRERREEKKASKEAWGRERRRGGERGV